MKDYEPVTSALKFLTLQTNEGAYTCTESGHEGCDTRRKVSLAYDGHEQFPHVRLLGNLEHQTEFTKEDLVQFAREVLTAFDPACPRYLRTHPIPAGLDSATYGGD